MTASFILVRTKAQLRKKRKASVVETTFLYYLKQFFSFKTLDAVRNRKMLVNCLALFKSRFTLNKLSDISGLNAINVMVLEVVGLEENSSEEIEEQIVI